MKGTCGFVDTAEQKPNHPINNFVYAQTQTMVSDHTHSFSNFF